jgi:hypothetical protein
MPQINMPPNWIPPVDAWQSAFAAELKEVVFGYFACQFRDRDMPQEFADRVLAAVQGPLAPAFITRARHRDASMYENELFIAYWPGREAFKNWWDESGFGAWFDDADRASEGYGLWQETYIVPVQRFETLLSSKNPTGVATIGLPLDETVREHNYWGGMRDRIPSSETDSFTSPSPEAHVTRHFGVTRGQRVKVTPGENICLIRSGQNWSQCDDGELADYSDEVVPHLVAGMAYLRDNPAETGCLSCRLMDEVELDGRHAKQSFGLAAFTSMAHLEEWAKTHPTHLRIFDSFIAMAQRRSSPPKLQLWHEVIIASGQDSVCEYVNCHPQTGFLPYY